LSDASNFSDPGDPSGRNYPSAQAKGSNGQGHVAKKKGSRKTSENCGALASLPACNETSLPVSCSPVNVCECGPVGVQVAFAKITGGKRFVALNAAIR
jgi:hypothetical protein